MTDKEPHSNVARLDAEQREKIAAAKAAKSGSITEFSDSGLVDKVATGLFAGRFVWVDRIGYRSWGGTRWELSSDVAAVEEIRTFFRGWMAREAASRTASPERLIEIAKLQFAYKINPVASLVRGAVLRQAVDFDRHPNLLNMPSGPIDLRTEELFDPDPDLLLTKCTAVDYVPGYTHPDWTKAKAALPPKVCTYLLDRFGQAITGHTPPDDKLPVLQGDGENGKSTFLAGIAAALGDYAALMPKKLLLGEGQKHPTEKMPLLGVRFAFLEEPSELHVLDIGQLKEVLSPVITARYTHKDNITFDSPHTLFLSSNYEPTVVETDHGTWRRLELIRFPYTFVKRRADVVEDSDRLGDPGLRDRVKRDPDVHRAILADLVPRARRWYEHDKRMPAPPQRVLDDTAAWRDRQDSAGGFVAERLIDDPGWHVMSTDLLAELNIWLEAHGQHTWTDRTMASRLTGNRGLPVRMEKRAVHRESDSHGALDRPGKAYGEVPNTYQAWVGVRFRDL